MKILLYFSALSLAIISTLIPAAVCYGDDYSTAEEITNGTYSKTLNIGDEHAFYKIYCNPGDNLSVNLTVNYPTYELNIQLYNSHKAEVDQSYNPGSDEVSDIVDERGPYYMRIFRFYLDDGTLPIPFSLVISGATGSKPSESPVISGFGTLCLLLTIISTISLISFQIRKRK